MRATVVAGLLVIAALVGACGDDSKGALPAVSTTTPTVPPTAPPLPRLAFGLPEEAIRHLILQWQAGDQDGAAQAAEPAAIAALFAKPGKSVQFRSCETSPSANLGSDCVYRYEDGLIRLHLTKDATGWRVITAAYENVK